MSREHGALKSGRTTKLRAEAGGFSVEVVRLSDVNGPDHGLSNGETGAVIPVSGAPKFDGVEPERHDYPGVCDHPSTVTEADACVLGLLPEGAIDFAGK